MDVPSWIQQEIADFGLALHLQHFGLNDKGVAGVRFENGVRFELELHGNQLFVYTLSPLGEPRELLTEAHPRRNAGRPMHVGVFHGQAVRLVKLSSEEINRPHLEAAFHQLWK